MTQLMSGILRFLRKNTLATLLFVIPLVSMAMHWRVFQSDLVGVHVWRQVQTQSVVLNFYEEDFNVLNPRLNPRGSGDGIERLEFPLMQWLFACFYKVFGNHLVITRVLTFLVGIGTLAGMYFLVKNLFKDRLAALAGAWALNFSPAFFYYTVNPLPDNFALCCAVWGLAFFYHWYETRRDTRLFIAGFFFSMAAVCKLPFVLFFCAPFVCFLYEFLQKKEIRVLAFHSLAMVLFLVPAAAWYAWVIPSWHNNGVTKGILDNQIPVAQMLRYVSDNLVSILPEMLLNYAAVPFFIAGFFYMFDRKAYRDKRFLHLAGLGAAVIFYFLFEINMIANVHDYYLFPFVPLLFVIVSYGALQLLNGSNASVRAALLLMLLMPLTAFLRTRNSWNPDAPGFNKDWLAYKTELRALAPRDALCVAGNDFSYQIIFYYIDKKGWPFAGDNLTAAKLSGMIQEGAQYLYSDARQVDDSPEIRPLLDSLVLERGSLRVYRLKSR